jgi:hypothetical protein
MLLNQFNKRLSAVAVVALIVPSLAAAQIADVNDFFQFIGSVLNAILPLLIALAVIYFIWGVLKYLRAGDNPEMRQESRGFILNGVIAIFVMVSVWGLVNILVGTFSLNNDAVNIPTLPALPTIP